MFVVEKLDVLLLPEPEKPGVKTWPKTYRKAAPSGSLHTARFWLLLFLVWDSSLLDNKHPKSEKAGNQTSRKEGKQKSKQA